MRDYKEIFDDYMKRSKEELAALLTINDLSGEREQKNLLVEIPQIRTIGGCTSMDDCTNPQMDCIDCPHRGKTSKKYSISTTGTFDTVDTVPTTYTVPRNSAYNSAGIDVFQFTC